MIVAIWIVLALLIGIAVLFVAGALPGYVKRGEPRDASAARALIGLHGARRRLELSHVRRQIRSDGSRVRRQLNRELANHHDLLGDRDD